MKNFHFPLPEQTDQRQAAEASRKTRHEAIAAYAAAMAGTAFDLDPDIESTGIEHLAASGKKRK